MWDIPHSAYRCGKITVWLPLQGRVPGKLYCYISVEQKTCREITELQDPPEYCSQYFVEVQPTNISGTI